MPRHRWYSVSPGFFFWAPDLFIFQTPPSTWHKNVNPATGTQTWNAQMKSPSPFILHVPCISEWHHLRIFIANSLSHSSYKKQLVLLVVGWTASYCSFRDLLSSSPILLPWFRHHPFSPMVLFLFMIQAVHILQPEWWCVGGHGFWTGHGLPLMAYFLNSVSHFPCKWNKDNRNYLVRLLCEFTEW